MKNLINSRRAAAFLAAFTLLFTPNFVACEVGGNNNTTPVEPTIVNPNPDDKKPGNENPDNKKPDNENTDDKKPDDKNPETPPVVDPENPDDKKPDKNLNDKSPAEFTAEEKNTIANNVLTELADNIKKNIGLSSGVINKLIAIDFSEAEPTTINLLMDYTNNSMGNNIGLFSYRLTSPVTYEDLYKGDFARSDKLAGTSIKEFSVGRHDDRISEIMAILSPTDELNYDIISLANTSGDIFPGIGKTNEISISLLNEKGIKVISTNARSDAGYTDDPIGKGILNGKLGVTYTEPSIETYEFSENVLYDYEGLNNEVPSTETARIEQNLYAYEVKFPYTYYRNNDNES